MYLIVSWCYDSQRCKYLVLPILTSSFSEGVYGKQFCILSSSKTSYSLKCTSNVHSPNLLCHSGDGRLGGNEFVSVVLEVTWRVVEARAWFGGWPYVSLERQTALPFLQHFDRQVGVQLISSQTKWWVRRLALKFFPRAELLPSWASGLSGKSCRSGWFHTAADSC